MSCSIARSVREIKQDLGSIVGADQIVRLCHAAGHAWRDRTLCPVTTVYLLVTGSNGSRSRTRSGACRWTPTPAGRCCG